MTRWTMVLVAAAASAAGTGAALMAWASPVAADVAPGCRGVGTWVEEGETRDSRTINPGALIEIPQSDTVDWVGAVGDAEPGEETEPRPTNGRIQLKIAGRWVTLDEPWEDDDSVTLTSEGSYDYDLPSVLIGIELPLRGEHNDPSLGVNCSGSVKVKVEGSATSNPLTWGGAAGFVIFGGMLFYAGRPVMKVAG